MDITSLLLLFWAAKSPASCPLEVCCSLITLVRCKKLVKVEIEIEGVGDGEGRWEAAGSGEGGGGGRWRAVAGGGGRRRLWTGLK